LEEFSNASFDVGNDLLAVILWETEFDILEIIAEFLVGIVIDMIY
jgi:hypothetical protein